MKIKVIYSLKFLDEKQYIIDTIFGHFFKLDEYSLEFSSHINLNEVHIICEDCASAQKVVLNNVLFDFEEKDWLTERTLPVLPLEYLNLDGIAGNFLLNNIPVLYGNVTGQVAYKIDDTIRCDVDLFGGMFFLLTLYEEVVINKYDEHGRFRYLDSVVYKSDLHLRPVVNEYLDILKALFIKAGFPEISSTRKYQLILSHDVDVPFSHNASVFYFIRNIFADLILRKSLALFIKKLVSRLLPWKALKYKFDPYNNLLYLMKVSEKYAIKSQFNFIMVNGRGNIDGNYEISDEYFQVLLKEIHQRGHVIGLHPSYLTYNNFELLQAEYLKLKGILDSLFIPSAGLGGRQHYLRWRNPETWQIWDDIGLKYDSSIGSEYYMGFRCGTCFEFPVFNLITKQPLKLIEYPLLVMDVCAFKLNSKEKIDNTIMEIRRICRFYDGNLTFLFHNNYAVTKGQKYSYERLISDLI
jgi:hypothetical protein